MLRAVRPFAALLCVSAFLPMGIAIAQDAPPPGTPHEERPTTDEAQRAELAGHDHAAAATEAREGATHDTADEHVPGILDDADHPERGAAHHRTHVTADVFPETHPHTTPVDPDPELEEEPVIPPPEPEWRLRLGVGATAATGGGPLLSFRLTQELEWMPHDVAPILFSLTGGQLIGDFTVIGFGGARVGLYGLFCQDRIVTCMGTVALRAGVIGGNSGVSFDLGGDGDGRFRFDGVELGVRVGFFVYQGSTFVDLLGLVGAAF